MNTGMRTSTNSGIAGILSFGVIWVLSYFAPEFLASAPGDPEITGSVITGLFMWATARWSTTPAKPGKL